MVDKHASATVYKNYPGGSPAYQLRRISGGGDLFVVEAVGHYGTDTVYTTSIVEFRDGQAAARPTGIGRALERPAIQRPGGCHAAGRRERLAAAFSGASMALPVEGLASTTRASVATDAAD